MPDDNEYSWGKAVVVVDGEEIPVENVELDVSLDCTRCRDARRIHDERYCVSCMSDIND